MDEALGHYLQLMQTLDKVMERESFDEGPLKMIKVLCTYVRTMLPTVSWHHKMRFHWQIQNALKDIIEKGPTFEADPQGEDMLATLLERHRQVGQLLTMS